MATCGLELAVIASSKAPCPDASIALCERIIDRHPKSVMLPDKRVLPSGLRLWLNGASEYGAPKESKLHNSILKADVKTASLKESALRRDRALGRSAIEVTVVNG